MKYRYHILFLGLLASGLCSCKKEITLPYRSVDPVMVIEASVCQDSAVVRLSQTIDMETAFEGQEAVSKADVCITYPGGSVPFVEEENGLYRPAGEFKGISGNTYTLSVGYGGNEYTSSSKMNSEIHLLQHGYRTMEVAGVKFWLYSATIQDTPGEENYYVYYYYIKDKLQSWDILYDTGNDGEVLSFDIMLQADEMNPEDFENIEDFDMLILDIGDTGRLEIRSVDKKTYNYMYSLAVTMLTYGNPVQDFSVKSTSGVTKCFGFFSSYTSAVLEETFEKEETFPSLDEF